MLPASPDPRALRARLMERLGALRAYFEATSITVGLKSPYWSAFDALRRNQPLAEAFVADLQQLLEFLENDLVPALSQPMAAPARVPAPALENAPLNDQETRILSNLPPAVQRDLVSRRSAPASVQVQNEISDGGGILI